MKHSILTFFIFFLLGFCAAGQKSKDYKFVYRLQPGSFNDTTEFTIDSSKSFESIPIVKAIIKNYQSKPIELLTIILKSADTTIKTTTNEEGLFSIKLKPSNYELAIIGFGYKALNKKIIVDKENNLNLNVILARQNSMNWYNIHSRKKLSQADVNNIKNCIQNNEQSFDKCKKKYDYYITLEI